MKVIIAVLLLGLLVRVVCWAKDRQTIIVMDELEVDLSLSCQTCGHDDMALTFPSDPTPMPERIPELIATRKAP